MQWPWRTYRPPATRCTLHQKAALPVWEKNGSPDSSRKINPSIKILHSCRRRLRPKADPKVGPTVRGHAGLRRQRQLHSSTLLDRLWAVCMPLPAADEGRGRHPLRVGGREHGALRLPGRFQARGRIEGTSRFIPMRMTSIEKRRETTSNRSLNTKIYIMKIDCNVILLTS